MYQVSEAYRAAMKAEEQQHDLRGTIGRYSFIKENILHGSLSITNQCSDTSEIKIGQVYIGELKATFIDTAVPRYSWKGLDITIYFGQRLADRTYEEIPLGIFTVSEAEWTSSGVAVTAYDYMAKFDKDFSEQQTVGNAYTLAAFACEQCGVEFGMTEAEVAALPNGNVILSIYSKNDIETWRDYLSWLAQTLGCFATINRAGQLVFRTYGGDPVDTIDDSHRFTGASFSDFETRYTGMSVVDMKSETTNYYNVDPDDGLTYNLGSNPFLQYGTEEMYEARRMAVLDALQKIKYVPFKAAAIGNPAYDLGDVLIFSDGIADGTKQSVITKYVFGYNDKYEMQGVGKDPALSSAKSKSDKNIAGLLANVSSNELATYGYINADGIECENNQWVTVVNMEFATVNPKAKIDVWAEILLNTEITASEDKMTCEVMYLLGDEEQLYHPKETWSESGHHILGLHYFIGDVEENTRYQWIVLIKLVGGTASIASGDVHSLISGQGMAGEEGGNFKNHTAYETYPGYMLSSSLEIGHFFGEVDVYHAEPDHPQGIEAAFRGLTLKHGRIALSDFREDIVTVLNTPG